VLRFSAEASSVGAAPRIAARRAVNPTADPRGDAPARASRSKRSTIAAFGGKLGRQELQRHQPAKTRVLCLVNDTHSTDAQLIEHAIVGDGLTDHSAIILAPSWGLRPSGFRAPEY
jgi:hypothetical protein